MLAYREWRNLNDEVIGSICRCCIGRYFFFYDINVEYAVLLHSRMFIPAFSPKIVSLGMRVLSQPHDLIASLV